MPRSSNIAYRSGQLHVAELRRVRGGPPVWLRLQDLQGEGVRQRGAERVQGRGGHAVQVTRVQDSTCRV